MSVAGQGRPERVRVVERTTPVGGITKIMKIIYEFKTGRQCELRCVAERRAIARGPFRANVKIDTAGSVGQLRQS
jgi:hypothetical protein